MWYGGALGILSMRWMNEVVENLSFQCRVSVAVYQVLSSFYILIPTYFVPVKSWGRPLLKSWGRPLFVHDVWFGTDHTQYVFNIK